MFNKGLYFFFFTRLRSFINVGLLHGTIHCKELQFFITLFKCHTGLMSLSYTVSRLKNRCRVFLAIPPMHASIWISVYACHHHRIYLEAITKNNYKQTTWAILQNRWSRYIPPQYKQWNDGFSAQRHLWPLSELYRLRVTGHSSICS